MGVWIAQQFPLGRFHATRWRQNPFEDRYGEWPPSPWRMLRALAARWFQYARETGDEDCDKRRRLLSKLAAALPEYHLPEFAWRGLAWKQYQPVELAWSNPNWKKEKKGAVKQRGVTLTVDTHWCIPPGDLILWGWPDLSLNEDEEKLLIEISKRVLYFGRAESFCRLHVLAREPREQPANCRLAPTNDGNSVPVLAMVPGTELDEVILMSSTDAPALKGSSMPPGTDWFYARLPTVPLEQTVRRARHIQPVELVQFAVGGRVYPEMKDWVRLVERVRGAAIRRLHEDSQGDFKSVERLALFSGKDAEGRPLNGHPHAYFNLWPDDDGYPTRLLVWRRSRLFDRPEIEALWAVAQQQFGWGTEGWRVRLVPLPAETPPPRVFNAVARTWRSVTPFVPPAQRFRFRKNGRERTGELPERILEKLIVQSGLPPPSSIDLERADLKWMALHCNHKRRTGAQRTHSPFVRPGFVLRVTFPEPIAGPLAFGDSCHFGLGAFGAVDVL